MPNVVGTTSTVGTRFARRSGATVAGGAATSPPALARALKPGYRALFHGPPGTGKTTVAKIYGRVLKALRFLSNGEIVEKVARDGEKTPFHRMCISMITHPASDADTVTVLKQCMRSSLLLPVTVRWVRKDMNFL